jgi:hypothetical protein
VGKTTTLDDYSDKAKIGEMNLRTVDPDFLGGSYKDWQVGNIKARNIVTGGYEQRRPTQQEINDSGGKLTKHSFVDDVDERGMKHAKGISGATSDIQEEYSKLKSRAGKDIELSDAYRKAEELIGTKELQDQSKAVKSGEAAVTRAMGGQDMYGGGGGGARERMTGKAAEKTAEAQQGSRAKGASLLGQLASADLKQSQQRKFNLEDQLMPGAKKALAAQGYKAGMELRQAESHRPDINWQRNVVANNNQQLNQSELARHGYDVSMAAANAQAQTQTLTNILMGAALIFCDYNLKEDITKMDDSIEAVRNIDLFEFKYKEGTPVGKLPEGKRYGPMAQQVKEILPDAVTEVDNYLAVDKDQIIWALFSAVKELDKKVQELEKGNSNG